MSPVLNCVQSSPPSDQDTYPKPGIHSTNGTSNHSPPEVSGSDCVCEDERRETEEQGSRRSSPTTAAAATNNNNNNIIPLNYKKSPSPSVSPPIRPWNSSPNLKPHERGQSVSPSSSGHRPSPCPPSRSSISPDASSENSRIPSQASSEAHDMIASSPDSFRSPKLSAPEMGGDVPFPFHDNRLPSDGFRLSNSFLGEPINPYLRLPNNPLNPFQTPPGFLENPFLGSNDPKLLLNSSGLGLISQQLHHLNGFSSNLNKLHPPDGLQRMSMQQLQFLQTQLQSLPTLLTPPSFYSKFPDPKNHLSMLIQARKHPKIIEGDLDNVKKDVFRSSMSTKLEDSNPAKTAAAAGKERKDEVGLKLGKPHEEENMDVDNYEDNVSESDELLSVGSVSPPPPQPPPPLPPPPNSLPRANSTEVTDPGLSTLDSSSTSCISVFPNRTVNPSGVLTKKPPANNPPVRLQNGLTNAKTTNATNRTLKFSIDNILKSDFGNEETVKKGKGGESGKREKESERTTAVKKKPETEKETAVDLSQDNSNNVPGTETPMLWPAWVYCTRYSDRPSSGRSPRTRRSKNKDKNPEEKRPRTAFSGDQLSRLKHEFAENRYLTERRRQDLARELGLNEAQIKIWFQNKRAKMKKARGEKNPLALQLMAQGLYNHSTVPLTKEEEEAAAAELSD